jgi:hypothetical protein
LIPIDSPNAKVNAHDPMTIPAIAMASLRQTERRPSAESSGAVLPLASVVMIEPRRTHPSMRIHAPHVLALYWGGVRDFVTRKHRSCVSRPGCDGVTRCRTAEVRRGYCGYGASKLSERSTAQRRTAKCDAVAPLCPSATITSQSYWMGSGARIMAADTDAQSQAASQEWRRRHSSADRGALELETSSILRGQSIAAARSERSRSLQPRLGGEH